MSGEYRRYSVRAHVEVQLAYLHATPIHAPGVCRTCFGACEPRYANCIPCRDIEYAAGTHRADLVVPITYRNGSEGQHSQNLWMYKQVPANTAAATNLAALFAHFCQNHITCVKTAAGVEHFTHVCFVPSTKKPQGMHPLEKTLASKVRTLRRIPVSVNPGVQSDSRSFNRNWFVVQNIPDPQPQTDVLLIDDTWVTGSRAQSVAYQLKRSGARRVVIMVLARQIHPGYGPAKPLVERISSVPYDMDTCAFHAYGQAGTSSSGEQ